MYLEALEFSRAIKNTELSCVIKDTEATELLTVAEFTESGQVHLEALEFSPENPSHPTLLG